VDKSGIKLNSNKHTAAVPFFKKQDVDKLMQDFNGILAIRQKKHVIAFDVSFQNFTIASFFPEICVKTIDRL